jgi:hypothetical protein
MVYLLAKDRRAAIETARRYGLGLMGTGYRWLAKMTDVRQLPRNCEVWKVADWDLNPSYGTYEQVTGLVVNAQPKLVRWVEL